jgi:uncharacterized protein YlxP (DUF503 family)
MLHVGVLQFVMEIPYAESLKDKRSVVKAMKDRLRRSYNVSIAEIADLDDCTIATLGAVVAGSDIPHLNSTLDHLLNTLQDWRDATLQEHQIEIFTPR